jgi:hypothetical protein
MNTAIPESSSHDRPTPEDLTGAPACIEEDHPTVRLRGPQAPKAGRERGAGGGPDGLRTMQRTPTVDDLAGIPVCAEGDEDLTVGPRKPKT